MRAIAVGKQTVTLNGKPVHPGWVLVWNAGADPYFINEARQHIDLLASDEVEVTNELEYLELDDFN